MRQLDIVWKRLVRDGETCDRCGATFTQLERAVARLEAALLPLGIRPMLETQALDPREFEALPSESNRVWIAGRPLEDWLGARVGMSRCCSVCGDSDCRTLSLDEGTYETIPEELFVRAGLMAAAQLVAPAPAGDAAAPSCCAGPGATGRCGAPPPDEGGPRPS